MRDLLLSEAEIAALPGARRDLGAQLVPWQSITAVARPPGEAGWLHEVVRPGARLQACARARGARLRTRDGEVRIDAIAGALRDLTPFEVVVEGTLLAHDHHGLPTRAALDSVLAGKVGPSLTLYLTDLLHYRGYDLRVVPLYLRKRTLRCLLRAAADRVHVCLRLAEPLHGDGAACWRRACAMGFDGIVSKKHDAPYADGDHPIWLRTAARSVPQRERVSPSLRC
jgi:bifunctional non-homologous end joining protein LigD